MTLPSLVLAAVLAIATSQQPAAPAPAPQAPATEPKLHTAIAPVDRAAEPWWKERFEKVNARIRQGDVGMIFLGDSITQGWEKEGKEVWAKHYESRKAINLGFGGDRTQHVLWRLDHHGLEALAKPAEGHSAPKLVVLMIGTNNSNSAQHSAEEIGEGVVAIVKKLGEVLPDTKVLLLAIFPRNDKPDAQRTKLARASSIASKSADGKRVHYLDIGAKFLQPDGTLTKEVMPDFLHLSAAGYQIWADAIEPKVKELLGEPG